MEIIKGNNRFFIGEDAKHAIAEITFIPEGDVLTIDHTLVDPSLKGQGIGQKLVMKVVELAREENKKIIPVCPFAKKVLTGSEEYKDVLEASFL